MLTFHHAPRSRSTRIRALIHELGAEESVTLRLTSIPRVDGSGGPDPANPHPEKKVPLLDHDGALIPESAAICLYLTDLFPNAGCGPRVGDPGRGPYLGWLAWYAGVMEPVMVLAAAELSHPILDTTFRGLPEVTARLTEALSDGRPWLLGESWSAADLICHSPYAWFRDWMPEDPAVRDWVERNMARPASLRAVEEDEADMVQAA